MANVIAVSKDAFDQKELTCWIKNGYVPHNAISWAAENGHTEIVKILLDSVQTFLQITISL